MSESEDIRRLRPEDRYLRDPLYKHMVDALWQCIERMDLTPTEVREAAMLACLKYEERRGPARMIVRGDTITLETQRQRTGLDTL